MTRTIQEQQETGRECTKLLKLLEEEKARTASSEADFNAGRHAAACIFFVILEICGHAPMCSVIFTHVLRKFSVLHLGWTYLGAEVSMKWGVPKRSCTRHVLGSDRIGSCALFSAELPGREVNRSKEIETRIAQAFVRQKESPGRAALQPSTHRTSAAVIHSVHRERENTSPRKIKKKERVAAFCMHAG